MNIKWENERMVVMQAGGLLSTLHKMPCRVVDGGYIESGAYHYYLSDHLGNNRVVVNKSGDIVQKNHYYPFGMAFAETPVAEQGKQPYKYNNKELDLMHGLNLYDNDARFYDPTRPGTLTPDPHARKYPWISPYAWCGNNPVKFVDPTGEDYWSTNNPEQIRAFLNAVGRGSTQFDFSSGWNHMTDAEFADRLSYNDETDKYYISYGTVENDEVVINGRSFDANITPVSSSGEGYPGAFVYEFGSNNRLLKTVYDLLYDFTPFTDYLSPVGKLSEYYDGTNTWSVNSTGRITGIKPNIVQGMPPAVGMKGGKNILKEHTKNARPSTKGKHQAGQTRKQMDYGGEKGDANRRPPQQRPTN